MLIRECDRSPRRYAVARMDSTAAPRGLERDLRVLMTRRLRDLSKALSAAVRAELDTRSDSMEAAARISAVIEAVRRRWLVEFPVGRATDDITTIAGRVDRFTTRRTARAVARVAPVDVSNIVANAGVIRPMHKAWSLSTVRLIVGLESRHFADVERLIAAAVTEGKSTRTVTKVLQTRLQVSRRRANLIARNEIGNLNADITRSRMKDLGIRRFRWVTSADERVRPLHEEIDGQIFDYPNGHPTEGIPGQPINCRCTAEPILD